MLDETGLKELSYADCIHIHRDDDDPRKLTLLLYHVDDLITASNNQPYCTGVHDKLKEEFPMEDIGEPEMVLGIEIDRDEENGTLTLGQSRYVLEMLDTFKIGRAHV